MLNFKCMRCKYQFTDEQLQISPVEQIKQQRTESPPLVEKSSSEEEEISKILTEIVKNVTCPQCQSTVYLTGIGEIKGFEIDLTSEPLVQLVKGAINLVKNDKKKNISTEYLEYAQGIIDVLIHNPGKLIYFADLDLIKEAESAVNIIWDNVDTEELFTTIHSDLMVGMTIDYIRRAIKLKPTFLSVKPDNMVAAYFNNALEAWLFGLNSASLILCCSVIEHLLKEKLWKINMRLVRTEDLKREWDLAQLINNAAKEKILDESLKKLAHNIRSLRKDAVHNLKSITSGEAYTAIMNTKKIIEQLLK